MNWSFLKVVRGSLFALALVALGIQAGFAAEEPAPEFSVDGDGNVTALSFSGDGSGLTNLSTGSPWFVCGTLNDFDGNCQLPSYPGTDYEYGMVRLSAVQPFICSKWNVGQRVYNQEPFFVYSDNPENGMQHGGELYYRGTNGAQDDSCEESGTWRHGYWYIDYQNSQIKLSGSLGCMNRDMYCRAY